MVSTACIAAVEHCNLVNTVEYFNLLAAVEHCDIVAAGILVVHPYILVHELVIVVAELDNS